MFIVIMCGFFVGGCYYSEYKPSIAYPFHSFPSGGVFNKKPDYYHDYENHVRNRKKEQEEHEEQERSERFKNFFKGFFGFNQDDSNKESLAEDYPYNVFGLKRSASDDDMKKAYRKAVLKAHPDKGGSNELFKKVRDAWEYFSQKINFREY
jgi:hypothetical protein